MKKRAVSLVLLVALILAIPAHAASSRAVTVRPTLSIDGNTATCKVQIFGDNADHEVYAVIKLWKGDSCVKTWIEKETFYLIFQETATVSEGEYTLTVDATVNGEVYPQVSVSSYCD